MRIVIINKAKIQNIFMLTRQQVILTLAGASILFVGCSSMNDQRQLNHDQITELQTRTIAASKRDVYDASLTTLENSAYMINSADYLVSNEFPAFIAATDRKIALNISVRNTGNEQSQVRINAFDLSQFYSNQIISTRSSRYSIPIVGGLFAAWDWMFIRQQPLTSREDGIIDDPDFYDNLFFNISEESELNSVNHTSYS